jgi:hypothetical protein
MYDTLYAFRMLGLTRRFTQPILGMTLQVHKGISIAEVARALEVNPQPAASLAE